MKSGNKVLAINSFRFGSLKVVKNRTSGVVTGVNGSYKVVVANGKMNVSIPYSDIEVMSSDWILKE